MGTSKSYGPPTGHLWKDAKTAVTGIVKNNGSTSSIGTAVSKYVKAIRDNNGSMYHSKQGAISRAGSRLAGFVNGVQVFGLNDALKRNGLENLIGKSPIEIYIGLVDYFTDEGSSLNEAVVRDSMCEFMSDIFEDVYEIEKMEEVFREIDIQDFIRNFIIKCIQKDFLTTFSEKILAKSRDCKQNIQIQDNIKEFIKITIENNFTKKEITNMDWNGGAGREFISTIYEDTLKIFVVWSDSLG